MCQKGGGGKRGGRSVATAGDGPIITSWFSPDRPPPQVGPRRGHPSPARGACCRPPRRWRAPPLMSWPCWWEPGGDGPGRRLRVQPHAQPQQWHRNHSRGRSSEPPPTRAKHARMMNNYAWATTTTTTTTTNRTHSQSGDHNRSEDGLKSFTQSTCSPAMKLSEPWQVGD